LGKQDQIWAKNFCIPKDMHSCTLMVVKPTEDVLFHRFKYFFHLMIASEHCNDQKICLFY